jgi:hypothetical protein
MIVAVVGAGVAGCAAALSAAGEGAEVVLLEAGAHLGGVAARGEHRTLCGFAAIDGERPDLLEPELTSGWLDAVAIGGPYRRGRVWLWPTSADALQAGLARRLREARVDPRFGATLGSARVHGERLAVTVDGGELLVDRVIDASGSGAVARALGLAMAPATQWSAHRAVLRLALAPGPAARSRALARAQAAVGAQAAIALTPLDGERWQLSLDVPRGTGAPAAAALAERVASALDARLEACAVRVADRDDGRPAGVVTLAELFAERERGLCWAAWPREEHLADGVAWTWPPRDRHGVPERAARAPGAPAGCWFVGRGMPVDAAAAAALRVTGSGFALGAAVGARAARG